MTDRPPDNEITKLYARLEDELSELIAGFKFSSDIGLRLERMQHLLQLLGHPERKFRAVHIGGTSGKGSTATLVAAILQAAGFQVGVHTSPHLQIVNERHQVNGRLISTTALYAAWQTVKKAVEEVQQSNRFGSPSYFEVQVALSFLIFAEAGVDFGVIEVGLGGRIDPTNVIPAEVAILTAVGLDHTEILGDTIEKIIQDKAGIIKTGQKVISGCWQPAVQKIITQRCQQKSARLWQLGRDFRVQIHDHAHADFFFPGRAFKNVEIALQGEFQAHNAALAIAAVRQLEGVEIPENAIRDGLANAALPGRVEIMQQNPLVIIDGAHNPDKIRASASIINQLRTGRQVITVLGVKKGKDAAEIVPPLAQLSDQIILTTFQPKGLWTAFEPVQLGQLVVDARPDLPLYIVEEPLEALDFALSKARSDDIVLVTGSLYLVGDVRERWFPRDELLIELEYPAKQPTPTTPPK